MRPLGNVADVSRLRGGGRFHELRWHLAPSARLPWQNLILFTERFTPADLIVVISEPGHWDDWRKGKNAEQKQRSANLRPSGRGGAFRARTPW